MAQFKRGLLMSDIEVLLGGLWLLKPRQEKFIILICVYLFTELHTL